MSIGWRVPQVPEALTDRLRDTTCIAPLSSSQRGRYHGGAARRFLRRPSKAAAPGVVVDRQRFEELVSEALESLPARFAESLSNIDVEVRDWPRAEELRAGGVLPGRLLLGLYRGVPQTRRSGWYNMALPDRVFIFQRPIERVCRSDAEIRDRVRRTVVHEIAHHFGWNDPELAEMEEDR